MYVDVYVRGRACIIHEEMLSEFIAADNSIVYNQQTLTHTQNQIEMTLKNANNIGTSDCCRKESYVRSCI